MARIACVAVALALLVLATPAQASFDSCQHLGDEVVATFGSGVAGTLHVGGGAIRADGNACGTATVNNVNRIVVIGDGATEQLTIDLGGGPFAPGMDEAGTTDPEIEFEVGLGTQSHPFDELFHADVIVLGHATNADFITAGFQDPGDGHVLNLNANEATGDADVDFAGIPLVDLDGRGGADVIDAGGGEGTGDDASPQSLALHGRAGGDTISYGQHDTHGGAGDDQLVAIHQSARLTYAEAAGPVTLELGAGTFGGTGALLDGDGGTDTFAGFRPSVITLSPNADVVHGGPAADFVAGGEGIDTMNGGGAFDTLWGEGGNDILNGDASADSLDGGTGDDDITGGAGNDSITGGKGDDDMFGGTENDVFSEEWATLLDDPTPNGADDVHGEAGIDRVTYGTINTNAPFGRANPVSVDLDGVADDGEQNEGDNVMPDVEDVAGGLANDTLTGDGDADILRGYDGADTLRGGGGDDTLHGVGIPELPFTFDEQLEAAIADEADDIDGQGGSDTIFANEGVDAIEAREGVADTITCGADGATGRADRIDTLAADCGSGLAVPPADTPPADPPAETPPVVDPPVQPPVALPPVVVPPVVVPPPPKVGTLLTLPSARRCASRRKFTVRVRREIRGSVRRVTIFINGRRVKSVTGRRIGLPIDLRGLPKGRIRVRLRVELTDGRVATDTRTYRTCATKKRRGQFGRTRG